MRFGSMYLLVLVTVIVSLAAATSPGCQAVGPEHRQDAFRTDSRARAPNSINLVDSEPGRNWNYSINSAAAGQYTEINADGSLTRAAHGAPTRDLFLVLPDGKKVTLSSGSDVKMSGLSFQQNGATESTVMIDHFETISSEPQRAANEALAAMVPAWQTLTEAERETAIAQFEELGKLGNTLAPIVVQALRALK